MCALGFGAGERSSLLRLLAFLLKLGNVEFEPAHLIDGELGARLLHRHGKPGAAGGEAAAANGGPHATPVAELEEACALVGVAADELAAALGAARDAADGPDGPDGDGESERESESDWCADSEAEAEAEGAGAAAAEWCRARRDRLLAALYGRLFTWLVTSVNARLRAAQGARTLALSILDVYGLETLAHNALERLLLNYAAERLQACVTRATLRREQDEYAREGLAWAPLRVPDHDLVADLLDAVRPSAPRPLPLRPPLQRPRVAGRRQRAGRTTRVQRARARRRRAAAAPAAPPAPAPAGAAAAPLPVSGAGAGRGGGPAPEASTAHVRRVVHFGGAVVYSARGMAAKNRDGVCRRLAAALSRAADPLLAALFPHHSPHSPRAPRRSRTPAGQSPSSPPSPLLVEPVEF